jgi:type VI secretion system secreted protein Hcp
MGNGGQRAPPTGVGRRSPGFEVASTALGVPATAGWEIVMMRGCFVVAVALLVVTPALEASAAESVSLFLKLNGKEVVGENAQTSLGRQASIECASYEQEVGTPLDAAAGKSTARATGRRQYEPIRILKRIDKSSPLLLSGLLQNMKVEARFQFYRPNPQGDGTVQLFYTVEINNGRIASVKQLVAKITDPANANLPPLEEVTFVFDTIKWTYAGVSVSPTDSVTGSVK